jgi:predicted Zn finger-like uncharacterized protein
MVGQERRHDSPIMILCPHCATTYRVDPASLGPSGRAVRCVRCRTVWFAKPPVQTGAPSLQQRNEALASELAMAAQSLSAPVSEPPSTPPEDPWAAENEVAAPETSPAEEHFEAYEEPRSETSYAAEPGPVSDPEELLHAAEAARHSDELTALGESPSIVPPIEQLAALPTALPDPMQDDGDGESFVARRERLHARRRKGPQIHLPGLPVTILLLMVIVSALIGWRKTIVRYLPQTASLYSSIGLPVNLRGLVFDNIKTSHETQDGIVVLVVEGTIGSKSSSAVEVPRLRFAVRNAKGGELYSWTAVPSRTTLAPGEQLPFRSRLASPPVDARDVTVRFFTRHDTLAGMR